MKLAIIGSRGFNDYDLLKTMIDLTDVDLIVSGGAKGADSLANILAEENQIPIKVFLPEWKKYGYRAGFIRNSYIIEEADKVIAFWDGQSKGTLDSINKAKILGKPITIVSYNVSNILDFD